MYFVASLSGRGLAPATIAGRMSAIGFLHKLNGVPDPVGSGVVQRMLQGVRRMGRWLRWRSLVFSGWGSSSRWVVPLW